MCKCLFLTRRSYGFFFEEFTADGFVARCYSSLNLCSSTLPVPMSLLQRRSYGFFFGRLGIATVHQHFHKAVTASSILRQCSSSVHCRLHRRAVISNIPLLQRRSYRFFSSARLTFAFELPLSSLRVQRRRIRRALLFCAGPLFSNIV
jgi:hypothetical protein